MVKGGKGDGGNGKRGIYFSSVIFYIILYFLTKLSLISVRLTQIIYLTAKVVQLCFMNAKKYDLDFRGITLSKEAGDGADSATPFGSSAGSICLLLYISFLLSFCPSKKMAAQFTLR